MATEGKVFVVRMSDGHEVKLTAKQQLGTPATPYFVDERQDTVAGFGVVMGWWLEECEVEVPKQASAGVAKIAPVVKESESLI